MEEECDIMEEEEIAKKVANKMEARRIGCPWSKDLYVIVDRVPRIEKMLWTLILMLFPLFITTITAILIYLMVAINDGGSVDWVFLQAAEEVFNAFLAMLGGR